MPADEYTQKMEYIFNQMYPGLTMYVRDVNLPEGLAHKYTPGLVIRERAYVDASRRVMGMATTHRYAILSNHMLDVTTLDLGEDNSKIKGWGLCMAKHDSHFKVLAVHEYEGKTLIILLHLPDDETWKLLVDVKVSIDDEFVSTTIERFEAKCNAHIIPELATEEWLLRCSFPLGINNKREFHALEDE